VILGHFTNLANVCKFWRKYNPSSRSWAVRQFKVVGAFHHKNRSDSGENTTPQVGPEQDPSFVFYYMCLRFISMQVSIQVDLQVVVGLYFSVFPLLPAF
jgi:hypothetical protein